MLRLGGSRFGNRDFGGFAGDALDEVVSVALDLLGHDLSPEILFYAKK